MFRQGALKALGCSGLWLALGICACREVAVTAQVTRVELYGLESLPQSMLTIAFTNSTGTPCRLKKYFIEDEPMRLEGEGVRIGAGERIERKTRSLRISPNMKPDEVHIREIVCAAE